MTCLCDATVIPIARLEYSPTSYIYLPTASLTAAVAALSALYYQSRLYRFNAHSLFTCEQHFAVANFPLYTIQGLSDGHEWMLMALNGLWSDSSSSSLSDYSLMIG